MTSTASTVGMEAREAGRNAPKNPDAGVTAELPDHVYVEVSGLTGTGKSAVLGEIEIALTALGLTVETDAAHQSEKNATHADWQTALDLYKPTVVLRERNISRAQPPASVGPAPDGLLPCPFCGGNARTAQRNPAKALWFVQCDNCDASQHGQLGIENAITAWNTRAPHPDREAEPTGGVVREVLLLASYCGDSPACSDSRPCADCIAMCNVYRCEAPGEFVRELGVSVSPPVVEDSLRASPCVPAEGHEAAVLVPIEALQRLILAADSYGARYLDSDDLSDEAEELQAATEAMKDLLSERSDSPDSPDWQAEAIRAHGFIFDLGCDLHSRRVGDWFPEGAHNAADQMSEDMRLLGNACADFIPLHAGGEAAVSTAEQPGIFALRENEPKDRHQPTTPGEQGEEG